jgi:hypothetical protein
MVWWFLILKFNNLFFIFICVFIIKEIEIDFYQIVIFYSRKLFKDIKIVLQ